MVARPCGFQCGMPASPLTGGANARDHRRAMDTSPDAPFLTPAEIAARVLHRDPEVLVIDKPAGLAVHKAGRFTDHLGLYLPHLAEPGEVTPRLAHRLDRDTAGCLILGRTDWALKRLGRMFEQGHVAKTYWAVAEGVPAEPEGVIDLPLLKVTTPGAWTIMPHADGQTAVTAYRLLGSNGTRAWIEFAPRTGRTHQIRVHAAAIGCPLLGEPFYGPERRPPGNLHLLARRVAFRLSLDRAPVAAEAPVPAHMREAFAACGWSETVAA